MKTIVLYGRRNTAMVAIPYLMAKGFRVIIISDDEHVLEVGKSLKCLTGNFSAIELLEYNLFICIHGNKIIPKEWLKEGRMINVHPCLDKYKGRNPIKNYIQFGDKWGSVSSHFMTEQVDEGEVIHTEHFYTGKVLDYAGFYNIALPYYLRLLDKTLEKVIV
jgi:methionyl-tRNA formyltransferase